MTWPTFNISGITYDEKNYNVQGQTGTSGPQAVFIKEDGLKMYVTGGAGEYVYQYTLSTAWDVSTSSYDDKSIDVTAAGPSPWGLFFSTDGTKMYVSSGTYDAVYQWSLSTAWDVSTATDASKYVSSESTNPRGIYFKSDGLKMYLIDAQGDSVYQYTLSTAWDLSTASYASKSFSVSSQENNGAGIFFNDAGTKMYIVGLTNRTIYQYTLSTAWDVSTASYDSDYKSVFSSPNQPAGLFFKPDDGAKLYIAVYNSDTTDDIVYQYSTYTTVTFIPQIIFI